MQENIYSNLADFITLFFMLKIKEIYDACDKKIW